MAGQRLPAARRPVARRHLTAAALGGCTSRRAITLIFDNLNTHTKGALYTTFPPEEACRLANKIEIRHTPKHGSWLNIAELEFAVLGRTVFKKRIHDKEQLQLELDAICAERNAEAVPVRWQFNLSKARKKMAWAHPTVDQESS